MCYKEDRGADKTPIKCEPLEIILTIGNLVDGKQKHILSKLAMFTNKIELGSSAYTSKQNPTSTEALHAIASLEDSHDSLEEFLDDVFEGVETKMFGIGVSQYSVSLDIIEKFDQKFYSNLMNDKKPEVFNEPGPKWTVQRVESGRSFYRALFDFMTVRKQPVEVL